MGNKMQFDAVVIGSGIGGMCAGARLAHKGYKTLVVERLDRLGGRCSTIEVEGFLKSTGAILTASNNIIDETFREVGAEWKLRKVDPPCIWRIEGKDYTWPVHEGLMQAIMTYGQDKEGAQKLVGAMARAIEWQIPTGDITLKDWISQFTEDERIISCFAPLLQGWLCLNVYEIPAFEFFKFMKAQLMKLYEVSLPPNGNERDLMLPLAKVVEDHGGEVWKNTSVKRILLDQYKVTGVVVDTFEGEKEISAKAVVSNVGPKKTVELAGRENFDKAYLRVVDAVKPVPFFMDICVVCDEPMLEYQGPVMTVGARKVCATISHTMSCPDVAPPGKHILNAYAAMAEPVRGPIDKEKEIKEAVEELGQFVPIVKSKGRILSVDCFEGDWPIFHSTPTCELPQKTSVINLYNVGDGVRISEFTGTCLAAETARVVAEDIARHIEPCR